MVVWNSSENSSDLVAPSSPKCTFQMFTNEISMYGQQRIKPEAFASEHSYKIGAFYSRSTFISLPAVLFASCCCLSTQWLRLTASPNNIKLFHWRVPALILLLDLYSMIEIDHFAEQHQITDSSFSNPTSLQIDHLQESFASWLVRLYVFWKMITQMTLSNGASTQVNVW